jgi:AcrR family transcriptional regulator
MTDGRHPVSGAALARPRRRYDNTLRRERAAATRDRIVTAGAELLRQSSVRDWRALTMRAVAAGAGVNERTVFRHFSNERALRDAVMHRLEEQVGVDLGDLHLADVGDVTARIFRHLGSYPREQPPALDPTLADANRRQHEALLGAVTERAGTWPPADRVLASAVLDVLWGVATYDRLTTAWDLDAEEAITATRWVIGLIEEAVTSGRRPGG